MIARGQGAWIVIEESDRWPNRAARLAPAAVDQRYVKNADSSLSDGSNVVPVEADSQRMGRN
jgi:hypothetical protein